MLLCEVNSSNYKELPEIQRYEVVFNWATSMFGGPLTGILTYNKKKYYFSRIDEQGDSLDSLFGLEQDLNYWPWKRYLIVELDIRDFLEEARLHSFYLRKVGKGRDFHPETQELMEDSDDRSSKGYEEYLEVFKTSKWSNYQNNRVIGWFED